MTNKNKNKNKNNFKYFLQNIFKTKRVKRLEESVIILKFAIEKIADQMNIDPDDTYFVFLKTKGTEQTTLGRVSLTDVIKKASLSLGKV